MAAEPESIQAILRGRRRAGFVGRGGQLAVFRENFGLPPAERAYVFNVYGEGGVGKSTLLEQWRQIARAAGAADALVDERVFSAPEAMSALLDQLAQPREAKEFRARYASFRKNRERLESDPQAPRELWSRIVRTGVKAGLHASKAIPGAAPVVDLIDGDTAADAVDRVRQFLTAKVRDSREVQLMLYPTEELGPLFAATVGRIAAARPVVLFFDTFEQSGVVLEEWLIDLMAGAHGDLPPGVTLVIAGRLPLDVNRWAELFDLIAPVPLTPFTDVETRQLLAAHEVTDDRTVETIRSLSGGLPLLVDMLAKSRPARAGEVDDPADTAVERFLKWEPDETRRQAALAGALPRRIDEDLLRAALGRDDVTALFDWLAHQAFVRGDRYHDVVRSPMLRHQRQRSPQRCREAHARLAAAYRESAGPEPDWASDDWRTRHFEAVYHGLCARETTLAAALADAEPVVNAGIAVARRWAEMLVEAGRDGDDRETGEVGARLFEVATRGEDDVTELLTCLIDLGRHDDAALARLLVRRARRRYFAELDAPAIEDCTRAIQLDGSLAAAHAIRGAARGYQQEFERALDDFARALELAPDDAWALSRRGETYRLMGRYEDAVADFDRAIGADGSSAWTYGSRSQVLRALNRVDEALADLTRAIELDDAYAWAHGERGQVHRINGDDDQAVRDLTRAIELDDEYAWAYAERGEVRCNQGRLDEALADFTRAIELDDEYDWALAHRGETYRLMGRYEDALRDFDRAIEINPSVATDAWTVGSRGQTLRSLRRYDEALADFDRAIAADDAQPWLFAERGKLRRLLRRPEEALADLDRAIELNPGYRWALGERAETHRVMKHFDQALADFDRAIALDAQIGWAYAMRGEAYRQSGRPRQAIDDFDRAMALDGEDTWTLGSRGQAYAALPDLAAALRDLDRALAIGDAAEDSWVLAERGDVHRRLGHLDLARADLDRAIELDDDEPRSYVLRGVLRAPGDQAEADFRRAKELDPTLSWTLVDGMVVFED